MGVLAGWGGGVGERNETISFLIYEWLKSLLFLLLFFFFFLILQFHVSSSVKVSENMERLCSILQCPAFFF